MTVETDTARRLAATVDVLRSIVTRSAGRFGTVAVHLPGSRLDGIRHTDDGRWEVHVVMASDATVSLVEADVLAAARSAGADGPIDVFIEDIADRPDRAAATGAAAEMLPPGGLP